MSAMWGAIARKALPRWEMEFFCSAVSSAVVTVCPSAINTGSYPKPPSPLAVRAIEPYMRPTSTNSRPSGITSAAAHTNAAPRCSSGTSPSWSNNSRQFASSSPCEPAQRAENTPGEPPSTSTAMPESSASAGRPEEAAKARALISELAAKVTPSSIGEGAFRSRADTTSARAKWGNSGSRIAQISSTLWALWVAIASRAMSAFQCGSLQSRELRIASSCEGKQLVELGLGEGDALGGALDLHKAAVAGHHHVHVGVCPHILDVGQVQHRRAVNDANRHGRDRVLQRLCTRLNGAVLAAPSHRIGQSNVSTGNGGGASAAICLKHVTVEHDGVLA